MISRRTFRIRSKHCPMSTVASYMSIMKWIINQSVIPVYRVRAKRVALGTPEEGVSGMRDVVWCHCGCLFRCLALRLVRQHGPGAISTIQSTRHDHALSEARVWWVVVTKNVNCHKGHFRHVRGPASPVFLRVALREVSGKNKQRKKGRVNLSQSRLGFFSQKKRPTHPNILLVLLPKSAQEL